MNANPTSTPAVESTDAAAQANLDLAENLREAAHWLEMHAADVPAPWIAYVHFRLLHSSSSARAELTAFAAALGDRARETRLGDEVRISAEFGLLKLVSAARVAELRDGPPPQPEYEPILEERRDA